MNSGYIVFDIETIVDGDLLSKVQYAGENLSASNAISKEKESLLEASNGKSDFINPSFHIPVSVCFGLVDTEFRLQKLKKLDNTLYRPYHITKEFWEILESNPGYKLVDFNGRSFDLPVMEINAFRFGIATKTHYKEKFGRRYRFGDSHIDLFDFLGNNGSLRLKGGLNLFSKMLGKPGKMETKGSMVEDLYANGKVEEINDYCLCDVLDTYFVFLRTRVLAGFLTIEREQEIVADVKSFIQEEAKENIALENYLENWGDWKEIIDPFIHSI